MRMHEFSRLANEEKAALLYRRGVYIGKRKKGGAVAVLYQYDSFYVEIYYYQYRRVIYRISCFAGTERLNPYLPQVEVELPALGV